MQFGSQKKDFGAGYTLGATAPITTQQKTTNQTRAKFDPTKKPLFIALKKARDDYKEKSKGAANYTQNLNIYNTLLSILTNMSPTANATATDKANAIKSAKNDVKNLLSVAKTNANNAILKKYGSTLKEFEVALNKKESEVKKTIAEPVINTATVKEPGAGTGTGSLLTWLPIGIGILSLLK